MKSPLSKERSVFPIEFMVTAANTHSLQRRREGVFHQRCQFGRWSLTRRLTATLSLPPTHRPSSSVFQSSTGKAVRQLHLLDPWRYRSTQALSCCHYSCGPKHCPRSSCRISGIVFTAFRSTAACRQFTLFSIVLMKGQPRKESTVVDFSILPKREGQSLISIGRVLP